MITITDSTNYIKISFDDSDPAIVKTIRKEAIARIDLTRHKFRILEIHNPIPVVEFDFDDVTAPAAADESALYSALIGYL